MNITHTDSRTALGFKDAIELAHHIAKLSALLASNLSGNNSYSTEGCSLVDGEGAAKAGHFSITIGA